MTEQPKILHLTLKRKWFDLIASGEKKEEYREIKEYWKIRFLCAIGRTCQFWGVGERMPIPKEYYKPFDVVVFKNGYRKNAPMITVEIKEIFITECGNPSWGFEGKCFAIKLGNLLSTGKGKIKRV